MNPHPLPIPPHFDPATVARLRRLYGACLFWTRRLRLVEKHADQIMVAKPPPPPPQPWRRKGKPK